LGVIQDMYLGDTHKGREAFSEVREVKAFSKEGKLLLSYPAVTVIRAPLSCVHSHGRERLWRRR
jgi:hypothetical protein